MKEKGQYKTRQHEIILDYFLQNRNCQLTSKAIIDGLKDKNIGQSTIYRQISAFVNDGTLQRFNGSDGKTALYQYTGFSKCGHHFHLKCSKCGTLIHLDCEQTSKLCHHIECEHGFEIDMKKTVINGICTRCRRGNNE